MNVPFFNFQKEVKLIGNEVNNAIKRVIDRGLFVLNEEVQQFEKEVAGHLNVNHAISVGSGTDALFTALRACNIGPDDYVITTPLTAVPTVSAISLTGATPLFVDLDRETLNINPDAVKSCLANSAYKDKIKAIIPVHLYGHPVDMDAINQIALDNGIDVIEDVAQAFGAQYKDQNVGTIGKLGCFSFYPTKNLGAYGDGGMITTNDERLAETMRKLRNYGEKAKNENEILGFNSRLDEMQAAILRAKLPYVDKWNELRRGHAQRYKEQLSDCEVILPTEKEYARSVYHLFVIRAEQRDELAQFLREKGVFTQIHYPMPVYRQEAYQFLNINPQDFSVMEEVSHQILSLPIYPFLTDEQIDYTCSLIQDFFVKV